MSRRQHTFITFEVRAPLPVGWTQAKFLDNMRRLVKQEGTDLKMNFSNAEQVKIVRKETTYL